MENKRIFGVAILFSCASLFGLTDALKCYVCTGSQSSDCYTGNATSLAIEDCSASIPRSYNVLPSIKYPQEKNVNITPKCVQTTVKSNIYEKPVFHRSCGFSFKNEDVCKIIAQAVTVENCKTCDDKNNCNSSPGGK